MKDAFELDKHSWTAKLPSLTRLHRLSCGCSSRHHLTAKSIFHYRRPFKNMLLTKQFKQTELRAQPERINYIQHTATQMRNKLAADPFVFASCQTKHGILTRVEGSEVRGGIILTNALDVLYLEVKRFPPSPGSVCLRSSGKQC